MRQTPLWLPLHLYHSPHAVRDENDELLNARRLRPGLPGPLLRRPPAFGEHLGDKLWDGEDESGYVSPYESHLTYARQEGAILFVEPADTLPVIRVLPGIEVDEQPRLASHPRDVRQTPPGAVSASELCDRLRAVPRSPVEGAVMNRRISRQGLNALRGRSWSPSRRETVQETDSPRYERSSGEAPQPLEDVEMESSAEEESVEEPSCTQFARTVGTTGGRVSRSEHESDEDSSSEDVSEEGSRSKGVSAEEPKSEEVPGEETRDERRIGEGSSSDPVTGEAPKSEPRPAEDAKREQPSESDSSSNKPLRKKLKGRALPEAEPKVERPSGDGPSDEQGFDVPPSNEQSSEAGPSNKPGLREKPSREATGRETARSEEPSVAGPSSERHPREEPRDEQSHQDNPKSEQNRDENDPSEQRSSGRGDVQFDMAALSRVPSYETALRQPAGTPGGSAIDRDLPDYYAATNTRSPSPTLEDVLHVYRQAFEGRF